MPQPTAYDRIEDYSSFAPSSDPDHGTKLNTEFDAIETTLDEVLEKVDILLRDDDAMERIVGRDQLKSEVAAGVNTPTEWLTATDYTIRDSVIKDDVWYWAMEAHTSGTFATDLAAEKWEEIFDFSAVVADAETAAAAAATSATNAATSATTATTQATNAATSATNAATSATNAATSATTATTQASNASTSATAAAASATSAAASAATLAGTSTTSVAIGTGSKSFTTQSGKAFDVGRHLRIVSDADPTVDYMDGQVTAYTGTSLTVDIFAIGPTAAGTLADWSIYLAGARGAPGPAGAGSGDVVGPAGATENNTPRFADATGLLLEDSGTKALITDLTAITDVDEAADYVRVLDATDATEKKALARYIGAGKHSIWIPAAALTPRTTNGAAPGVVEFATNDVMARTLDYDSTTSEGAQFSLLAPKGWNESTITARFVWSHTGGAAFGVTWGVRGFCFSDDDAGDQAFGTEQEVSDTGGTNNDIYITSETGAVTLGGTPAEGDLIVLEFYRDPGDAGDTMGVDARLHGVMVFITTNANTDD